VKGRTVRKVYVSECANCGAWSAPTEQPEDAGLGDHREVDGVTYCAPCADEIEDE
jgi:hypothetical protein